ncbi:wax ester/triacylglycerol synthase domain-containing protein [Nocardioides litoris]|uniref:wax ester/triacylglycerol synthase domain-containing protein n=1 Tax=Nocardioides litoris TaxID=1926648 RepID=UPI00111ED1C3|nr:wax ester/triacylglycerol synthase domain-containing protein [Nocardioides litoris]
MSRERPRGIRLHGADASQLYRESPEIPHHTVKVLRLPDGARVEPDELVWHLQRRVDAQPFLRRVLRRPRVPLAHPWWEEAAVVDVRRQVSTVTLDAATSADQRAQLDAAVGRLLQEPLPRDRPLWRVSLAQGSEVCAVVVSTHHGLAAGPVNDWLLTILLGPEPAAGTPAAQPLASTPAELARLLGVAPRLAARTARAARTRRTSHTTGAAVAPFEGAACPWSTGPTARRAFASSRVSLAEVRAAGAATGSTVTEVLLAAVGGAVQEHLRVAGLAVDGARDVTAVVPMSLRVPGPPELQPANLNSSYFVGLQVADDDPRRRLAAIGRASRSARDARARTDQSMGYDVMELEPLRHAFYRAAVAFGRHVLHRPAASLVVSSVRGGASELTVSGHPVVEVASGGALFHDCGLNITTWTHGDVVTFGLVCDPTHLPGHDRLARSLPEQVRRLVESVV